jgi:hypothetical protein
MFQADREHLWACRSLPEDYKEAEDFYVKNKQNIDIKNVIYVLGKRDCSSI